MDSITLTFVITPDDFQRILASLDGIGYVYDPNSTLTDLDQRIAFIRLYSIGLWNSVVFNNERNIAIENGIGAAEQVKTYIPLVGITAS